VNQLARTWVRELPVGVPEECPTCGGRLRGTVRRSVYRALVIWCPHCDREGLRSAWRHFRAGRRYGYRACCRAHYALDRLRGMPSASLRSSGEGYAPCLYHARRRDG
jgi:hypothetical protein